MVKQARAGRGCRTHGKGNDTFLRRFNIDHDPDTSIVRERGTYALAGDVLTLTPTKSEREIWSKGTTGPEHRAILE